MPQEKNLNDVTATIPIPDEFKPSCVIPENTPEPEADKSQHKGDSTVLNSVLDQIFSQEGSQPTEALSIQADSSIDFRSRLELSGNKYKLEKLVTTGGFGRIFQAEDRILGRRAIVKTLKEEFLQNDKAIEHFISEAKLNSQLDHPGIIPLFSLDTDSNNGLHLAMQRITGITLKVFLTRCRELQQEKHFSQKIYNIMLKERLEMFLHICDTIAYCHDRGVLHNDLKPDNIMIGRYGQVYVMDWGIASMTGDKKPEKNTGSPAYMAPERICSRTLSKQTDIFGLGMILNEMVTLRPPIEAPTVSRVLEHICTGQFEPSSCIDPKRYISATLRAVIEKARAPNPKKRYSSVQLLANDIRHFLHNEETLAHPDSTFQKISRFLFHHRSYAVTLAVGVVLLFIAALGYNFYNAGEITRKANQETLRKLHWAKNTDNLGALIGKSLLLFQQQTANMGSALAIENMKKQYDTNALFYWNEDFAPGSKHRPPGLIHTAAGKGKALTLSAGTFYRFGKQISQQEIQDWANNFRAQLSQHSANVLAHVRSKDTTYKAGKLNLFYEYGSTVQRIVCVLDNGLVYCYPGKYDPQTSQHSFIPEYVKRELHSGKEFAWSSPYLDPASGVTVVSCWHNIRTLRGNKIGVIGIVVVFEDILQDFLQEIKAEKNPAYYTLIDSDMHLIYSSADKNKSVNGQRFYKWYSDVIRHIRKDSARNQFTALLDGKKFNITWRLISSSDWLFIQHVPLNGKTEKMDIKHK